MSVIVGGKDEIHYFEESQNELFLFDDNDDDIELQSFEGKKFLANRLLLISCSNFIRTILQQLQNTGVLLDQVILNYFDCIWVK